MICRLGSRRVWGIWKRGRGLTGAFGDGPARPLRVKVQMDGEVSSTSRAVIVGHHAYGRGTAGAKQLVALICQGSHDQPASSSHDNVKPL